MSICFFTFSKRKTALRCCQKRQQDGSQWHPPPPEEAGASSCKSKQSVLVRAVLWLQHKRAIPVCPTVVLYCVKVMHLLAAFPHFWYLPPHLHLCHDGFRTADNPTLLTQDFSFLHFCNHKQNRSGCLQKIYPLSQAFSPVPPVCISKMLWTFIRAESSRSSERIL